MTARYERPPRFHLHAVLIVHPLILPTLEIGAELDLVDGRHDLVDETHIHNSIRMEITDTDGTYSSLCIKRLQCLPSPINIAERLVQQIEVEIVQPEPVERCVESPLCGLVTVILEP